MPWAAYLGIGALVGFAAGLLGIGGGVVMVPLLVLVFTGQGLPPEHVLHVALGTAMAAMVFTSLASMRAHHAHGAVDWRIARAMSPGILAGSFAAALLAGLIPTRPLALLFTALVFYAATQILLDLKPSTTRELPSTAGIFGAGAVIGAVSSLVAAGGAFLTIPFLTWCKGPGRGGAPARTRCPRSGAADPRAFTATYRIRPSRDHRGTWSALRRSDRPSLADKAIAHAVRPAPLRLCGAYAGRRLVT